MLVAIGLLVMGLAAAGWGAAFLFNLRGATDRAVTRRNAVRAVTAARTSDLSLAEPSLLGAWFFRLVGGILLPAGLFIAFIGLVFTIAGPP
ncbi:hypothetical protein [Streptomyces zhihengii]